ncbi:protein mono-ADP-ribosyltransferase PARP14-like [Hippoglossus hippoglossus]|uniref:protein mono-ADP-ribosyltransferase PARP14-like n=1 Tax=Hippoglossus hippoglossus TaxID=8267 RepID=UPI00148C1C3A|nr:protein mono-ADP-ribosyltransferase PARP14-like [Hippoglossus hippoglossus]
MDEYQYPLFFEAKGLTDTEMKKVSTYFQIRRVSGGGDCAAIQAVGGDVYKICFKDKEDQERVLQKKLHMVSLPSGERHLTMSQTDSSQKPDQPSTPMFTKPNTKERQMCRFDPELQIHSLMIAMEGLQKVMRSENTQMSNLKKQVLEKRVNLPSDLIAFIKSRDAISKYETRFQDILINPDPFKVESDLVLSSLSSKAMVEAEEAVKRNLSVKTVKLQGAAAVPPDLDQVKEMLIKAKNVANSGEIRVDISFIPVGTTMMEVRLVGFSENVNQLEKVLCDYQMNQIPTQESLNLPFPELVDCLDEVLHLIGLKHTKVMLKTSTTPNPCVLLSGPRCHVNGVKQVLISALSRLTSDTLVLDGPGAQQYFQAEGKISKDHIQSSCKVLIREHQGVKSGERSCLTPVKNIAANQTNLQIKFGMLEDQQVNVLVVPMLHKKLTSTKVGKNLLTKAGNTLQSNFDAAANCTVSPGDVLQVAAPASLGCNKLFFIECLPWDGVGGQSVQALRYGLKRCLDLCVQQELSSVAFPMIGPGIALGYPLCAAIEALIESIYHFGSSGFIGSLPNIYVVIKPGYPDSKCYHDVYRSLSLNMKHGGQVIFRSPTNVLTLMVVAGVRLHVVFGDITHETTDAIVNSTDFEHFPDYGVCKDILAVAGPAVTAQVKAAKVIRGSIFQTEGGSFPCKAILHVCGLKDAGLIESLVCDLILHCESSGYRSIAIPAICAGQGGMGAGVVAQAILRGVKTAASSTPLRCVTDIRLVLIDDEVFLLFKEEALQVFSTDVVDRVSLPHEQQNPQRSVTTKPSILSTSFKTQQSVFLFLGLFSQDVSDAKMKLKQLYQDQCLTHTFTAEEVGSLSEDDIMRLQQLVYKEGLQIQSGQGNMTVSGLKDGVNSVMQMIKESQLSSLRRQVIVREEEDLHNRVAWCILGSSGNWERFPKTANHRLEHNNLAGGIMDEQSNQWTVDLQKMEATRQVTGETRKIKRLENLPDFTLPLYWDNMAAREDMKVVTLQESSAEYRSVEEAFRQTGPKGRIKIERLQNVHLRRAYEAQRKHISDKNAHVGAEVEKVLYHGTTQDNCDSIMKTGFNRRFAGQNATHYGEGTYFSVNASYSAHPTYAMPTDDGSQLIFVAQVLTGIYTEGKSDMKVPPPRDILLPHDRYDSVVDRMDNPSMYVVFHDNQAYPDYRITILGR